MRHNKRGSCNRRWRRQRAMRCAQPSAGVQAQDQGMRRHKRTGHRRHALRARGWVRVRMQPTFPRGQGFVRGLRGIPSLHVGSSCCPRWLRPNVYAFLDVPVGGRLANCMLAFFVPLNQGSGGQQPQQQPPNPFGGASATGGSSGASFGTTPGGAFGSGGGRGKGLHAPVY